MKEPAPRRSERRAAPKGNVDAVKRLDLELADGRYLLVYSRKPRA
jgi:hypothetical protein